MLLHKSVHVLPQVWRQLRINSEISGVSLRDFLTYLINNSRPVTDQDAENRKVLEVICEQNRQAVQDTRARESAAVEDPS